MVAFLGSTYGLSHFYVVSSKFVKQEILNHLETLATDRAEHTDTYLKQNIERLKLVTSRNKLRTTLKEYNSEPNQEKINIIKDIIISAKESVNEFERICVVGLDGIIITSTDNKFCGRDISDKLFFQNGKKQEGIYFVEEEGIRKIFVTGPFVLDEDVLGVGITVVKTGSLEEIVKNRSGLGASGEVLVAVQAENKRIYLFDRLFEGEALDQSVENEGSAEPIRQALQNNQITFENSLDYRDEPVFAVSRYIETGKVGLGAQIDKKDALGGILAELIRTALIIFILIVVFVTVVGYLVAQSISKPLEKLRQSARVVEKGDFDHKVGGVFKGEIGDLAYAFDKMTDAIKKSRAEVDIKVREQTKEITEKATFLANQQKAILNILEDVEYEKDNLSKERDKINTILYSIGDGVFVVDDDVRITMFNQIAADISGFSIQEALGKKYDNILKFIFEDTRKVNNQFIKKAIETGEVQEMANHTLLVSKDKKEIPVADSAAPLKNKDGKVIGCVVVFRDVTHERAVDQAKTEFVSLASHQLRTPLSAINWYTEMLLAGDAGKLNEEQKEYLNEVYKGNQRMVELVNALLNVSRLELGTFAIDPEKTDLKELVTSVVGEIKLQADKKEQKLKINIEEKLPKIIVDPKLVRIIFQNLLSNAVKYTPKQGKISLKMEKLDKDLLVQITDTGMGIPKRQQSSMFKKLFRADNVRETDTEGTGLGLYIIKSILDNTGGKIWFESVENKGTTFSFIIPLSGMKKKKGNKELT